jgi:outer membrane receptor protein involved in Fe transport
MFSSIRGHFAPRLTLAALLLALLPGAGAAQERSVEGVVLEAGSLRPLVAVQVTGGTAHTLTDAEGRFFLRVPAAVQAVTFQRLGYETTRVALDEWTATVTLNPQPIPLSGLVAEVEGRSTLARGTSLAVETVGSDHIHGRGHTSLAQSLDGAQGVSVAWTGAWGSRPLVRGLGGERLAILVDGSRVTRACNFGMDQGLATVDPASVERVEILSGPGSTLYGSGSMGGVINVVTRRPPADVPFSGEVRASAGSAARGGTLGGTAAWRTARADLTASADLTRFENYRTPEGVIEGSSYRQGTLDLKGGWTPDPSQRLGLHLQAYEGLDIGWPMHDGALIPEEGRRQMGLDYSWQRGGLVDAFSARGYVQRVQHHMTMVATGGGHGGHGGADPPMNMPQVTTLTDARSHATNSGGRMQLRLVPGSRVHMDAGVDLMHVAARGTRWVERSMAGGEPMTGELFQTWPAVRILNVGLFAQGEVRVGSRLALTGGVRGDRVERKAEDWESARDGVATGNMGFRLDLARDWALRASAGRGFRIPDATEYFGLALRPDGFVYRGDPELESETSLNLEASLEHRRGPLQASFTLFRNDVSNLIAPVAVEGEMISGRPVRSYGNLADARLTGGTLAVDLEMGARATLSGVLNHVRGEDRATGNPLPQLPPTEGSVALELRPGAPAWSWVELRFRGATRQTRNAEHLNEMETPGYGAMDLRTRFDLLGMEWISGVENLLDRAYRSHVDPSPTLLRPGRNFHLAITRRF